MRPRFGMGRHALQKSQCVANAVRGMGRELRRRQEGINGYNLLQQRSHRAKRMPENRREFGKLLALFAQLEQRAFPLVGRRQFEHECVQLRRGLHAVQWVRLTLKINIYGGKVQQKQKKAARY